MVPRKYIIVVAVISLTLSLLAQATLFSKPKERVLVLGFDSRQLNDVQDRLLRETIMRRFLTRGYLIVQVMEIESLFHDTRKRQIRKLKPDDLRSLCDELKAGFVCSGSISPEDGKLDDAIKADKNYICTIMVYRKDRDAFEKLILKIAGEKNLYRFYDVLADMIVAKIDLML
jgi:hypothetical protein